MQRLLALLKLLSHFHELRHKFVALLDVGFGHFVLLMVEILISDEVIELVFCFVLEHLCQKLSW